MTMGWSLSFDYTPSETPPTTGGKRETVQRINKTKMRTRYRTEW
jgi:hypothetical protein